MKKKLLLILPLIGMLWSCNKQNQVPSSQTEKIQASKAVKSARDGVYDVLGFGYDVSGEAAVTSSTTFPVIDMNAFVLANPNSYVINLNTVNNTTFSYGENSQDYSHELTAHFNISGGFSLFKASITSSYTNSNSMSSKYMYGSFDLFVQQKNLKISGSATTLRNYLTSDFTYSIANETPEYIINHFGAYVLTDINLGGKLSVLYRGETNSANRKSTVAASLQASVSTFVSVDAGITSNTSASSNSYNQFLHYVTYGGDPTKSISATTISFSPSTTPLDYGAWLNSVTPANSELIGIGTNGLIPIWDLIADATKSQAVHDYFNNVYVPNHSVLTQWEKSSLFRCYNINNDDRLLTTNPAEVSGLSSWRVEGAMGKVYNNAGQTGTSQLFRWYQNSNGFHFFTANANEVPSNSNLEGNSGYINTNAVAGYYPIYRYRKNNGAHMYSTSYNELGGGNGTWIYEGIMGYIEPAN